MKRESRWWTILVCLAMAGTSLAQVTNQRETTITMERYRPQFHFTSDRNWLNDPNGCVYYEGEYHLCFQHNPKATEWGNMTWGHALSPDLVHWQQLPDAIAPYGEGTIFSGTAVVDAANTSGFQEGEWKPLVALFTHTTKAAGQALAYSTDKGRTWKLSNEGRHVVPNQGLDAGERDPKVLWHAPTRKWVMVLWVKLGTARIFTSDNLKTWEHASDFEAPGFFECPDLFELAVDGNPKDRRWVIHDAAFSYWIGSFDGRSFKAAAGPYRGDVGSGFYAAQSWNNVPDRVVQIAWMRGGNYPGMPFNQQMSFPCELELRTTSEGVRLCRWPVKEISTLYAETVTIRDKTLKPGDNPLSGVKGELFDVEMTIVPGKCQEFGLRLHDQAVVWADGKLSCMGAAAPLPPVDGKVRLRLLVDRTSLEVFGNGGEVSISSCMLPKELTTEPDLYAKGGAARIEKIVVRKLRAARKPGAGK
jgi:fructan beta-fructosidase